MAFICDRCGKGKQFGRKIGRARQGLNYRSPKVFKPNLHPYRGYFEGKKGRYKFCTKCLRIVKKGAKSKPSAGSPAETAAK